MQGTGNGVSDFHASTLLWLYSSVNAFLLTAYWSALLFTAHLGGPETPRVCGHACRTLPALGQVLARPRQPVGISHGLHRPARGRRRVLRSRRVPFLVLFKGFIHKQMGAASRCF